MDSKISWTNHTFNPWRGCTMIHEGCSHCYAWRDAQRFPDNRGVWGSAAAGGKRVKASFDHWKEPIRWNRRAAAEQKRQRVFCASLADVFEEWDGQVIDHNGLPLWMSDSGDWIEASATRPLFAPQRELTLDLLRGELFALIDTTPWLDWMLLTKRPENILRMWPANPGGHQPYRPNVWLGTSVSLQKHETFVRELVKCRELSPVLFISAEPLLTGRHGLDLSEFLGIERDRPDPEGKASWRRRSKFGPETPVIDWVIVGGESGPKARAMHPYGPPDLMRQCATAGVSFHFKQWGEYLPIGGGYPRCPDDPDSVIFDGARRSLADFGYGDDIRFVKVGKDYAGNTLHGQQYLGHPMGKEVDRASA